MTVLQVEEENLKSGRKLFPVNFPRPEQMPELRPGDSLVAYITQVRSGLLNYPVVVTDLTSAQELYDCVKSRGGAMLWTSQGANLDDAIEITNLETLFK